MRALWALVRHEVGRFFEVANNTILPPVISAALYLVIFGLALGDRITAGHGEAYLAFLIPGLILMQLVMGSYSNPSGSLYMSRLLGYINDVLLSSMSYAQMAAGYIIGGVVRGLTLGLGVWLVALLFEPVGVQHPLLLLIHVLLITVLFAALGLMVGLWAKRHDQLNILMNFALTPLVFLGGVFYSIDMIPPVLQTLTKYNPLFYMVNGVRYSMTGVLEAPIWLGLVILGVMTTVLLTASIVLFNKGYGLRK
jgi:ABC-2 type transport system permease protein